MAVQLTLATISAKSLTLSSIQPTSLALGSVANTPPTITTIPTISGTAKVGETLTATASDITGTPPPTSTLQWQRSDNGTSGWSNISGATGTTYVLVSADETKYLRVEQTATNIEGSATATSASTSQVASAFTGLLDTYSGAAVAYSLRLLRGDYEGNCIRVRRADDNAEQNIGFRNNELDTSTLESFSLGGDCFVVTWFDQSDNETPNNATQNSASLQPKIVSSGTTISLNSQPAINGDGTDDAFELSSSIGLSSGYSIFQVNQVPSENPYGITISSVSTANASGIYIFNGLFRVKIDDSNKDTYAAEGNKGAQYLWESFVDSSNNLQSFRNSNAYGSQISDVTETFDFEKIGTNLGVNSFEYFQELIVYNSDQSSNRSGIETNINDHYSIYG